MFHKLTYQTAGAAETLLVGVKELQNSVTDEKEKEAIEDMPILSIDGDAFFIPDILTQWAGDNGSIVWNDTTPDPIYSYCSTDTKIDPKVDFVGATKILDIAEKVKISDYANAGGYGFASVRNLKKYCQLILDKDIRQKNEFYTSGVIKQMLNDGHDFYIKEIKQLDFITLGIPKHLRDFVLRAASYPEVADMEDAISKNKVFFPEHTIYSGKTTRNVPHELKLKLYNAGLSKEEEEKVDAYKAYLGKLKSGGEDGKAYLKPSILTWFDDGTGLQKEMAAFMVADKPGATLNKGYDYCAVFVPADKKQQLMETAKIVTSDASTTGRHIERVGDTEYSKLYKNVFLVTSVDELEKELGWYMPAP